MNKEFIHVSVLLQESIDGLNINEDGIYVDCTLGKAGHSKEILKRLKKGLLIGIDKDVEALAVSENGLHSINSNYKLVHGDYKDVASIVHNLGYESVDGILYDLGVSSYQFDCEERGFSYKGENKLDMRMDQSQELSAYIVVNKYSKEQLTKIFFEYGEEKFSKQIANAIVTKRQNKPIETTKELVEVIKSVLPDYIKQKKGHPAKQVFQAIRIEVNDELNSLRKSLEDGLKLLKSKGRMAVITFHSLEDRIVKQVFNEHSKEQVTPKGLINLNEKEVEFSLVNKHPILPSQFELDNNNRAHSAKLRIIEKR